MTGGEKGGRERARTGRGDEALKLLDEVDRLAVDGGALVAGALDGGREGEERGERDLDHFGGVFVVFLSLNRKREIKRGERREVVAVVVVDELVLMLPILMSSLPLSFIHNLSSREPSTPYPRQGPTAMGNPNLKMGVVALTALGPGIAPSDGHVCQGGHARCGCCFSMLAQGRTWLFIVEFWWLENMYSCRWTGVRPRAAERAAPDRCCFGARRRC